MAEMKAIPMQKRIAMGEKVTGMKKGGAVREKAHVTSKQSEVDGPKQAFKKGGKVSDNDADDKKMKRGGKVMRGGKC